MMKINLDTTKKWRITELIRHIKNEMTRLDIDKCKRSEIMYSFWQVYTVDEMKKFFEKEFNIIGLQFNLDDRLTEVFFKEYHVDANFEFVREKFADDEFYANTDMFT